MSAENSPRVGLVLTGGGAKGAYHVGALRAIAELNIPVHAVAGASVGALNAAIVATAGNMQQAYSHLQKIWESLADDKVIGVSKKAPAYISMMIGMGVAFRSMPVLSAGVSIVTRLAEEFDIDVPGIDAQVLDDSPLVKLLEQYTTVESLKSGLPLYVSVYETGGAFQDIWGVLKSSLRLGNTRESDFLHVQNLPDTQMQQALMASAALPMLFRARKVQGKRYTDGGQGDWYGVGGNTPVKPLVDAGCETIIVVHLCDGSAWDRNQYPNTNIIEVRPRSMIAQGNAVSDLLGFDHQRIHSWSQQGYEDAMHCLSRVFETITKHNHLTSSRERLGASPEQHTVADQLLDNAMKRLQ
jgi:NTE family protein